MTRLVLEHPKGDAEMLIKRAFERTGGIKKYSQKGRQIVGKTGAGLTSWGENVYVDISESPDENQTPIEVTAKKEVELNVTANAQKYKRSFIKQLESVRQRPIEDVRDIFEQVADDSKKNVSDTTNRSNFSETKELTKESGISDGPPILLFVTLSALLSGLFIAVVIL